MIVKLPKEFRPNTWYKKCALGVDLPASFVHDLWGLDSCLYPVYMPYRCLWDSVINADSGPIDDNRYQVNYNYGHTNFGFVLTDGQGRPVEEGKWHLFRWCYPHGIAHIINLDSTEPGYLNLLIHRLWLQDQYNKKYGFTGYSKLMQELDEEKRERQLAERQDMMNEIGKANSAMMNRAAQNFERGKTAPTRPQKEIIMSGAGLSNKSKIVRDVSDREGGLILPDGLGYE